MVVVFVEWLPGSSRSSGISLPSLQNITVLQPSVDLPPNGGGNGALRTLNAVNGMKNDGCCLSETKERPADSRHSKVEDEADRYRHPLAERRQEKPEAADVVPLRIDRFAVGPGVRLQRLASRAAHTPREPGAQERPEPVSQQQVQQQVQQHVQQQVMAALNAPVAMSALPSASIREGREGGSGSPALPARNRQPLLGCQRLALWTGQLPGQFGPDECSEHKRHHQQPDDELV